MSNDVSAKKKRSQYIMGIGALILVVGISAIGVSLIDDKKPKQIKTDQLPKANIKGPADTVNPNDEWQTTAGADVKALQLYNNELSKKLEQLENDSKAKDARSQGPEKYPDQALPGKTAQTLPPAPLPAYQPLKQPNTNAQGYVPVQLGPNGQPLQQGQQAPQAKQIFTMNISGDDEAPKKQGDQGDEKKPVKRNVKSYMPSGSFIRSLMLGGLDAPTGGQSQSNPHPVLFRMLDLAQLPNSFRFNVRECFATGAGFGDISSERAYIKIESLSCVRKNGDVIDIPVKGGAYVAGEDGKTGMRGRLVTKQGQVLANALLAGLVSGFGSGLANSTTTTSTSALGSTTSVDQGKAIENGMYSGVGKSMDRLAQFYINLAEKIFPVIEVDAGRQVDIVLTQGIDFDAYSSKQNEDYGGYWKRGREIQGKSYEPYPNR